ncbi:acyl-CoA dehydratase activase [Chitinispirillales bacterium ANBcel5]|uniref:acyl-CoA dehydratase activase n=1 Tax=Cellulosispirillum alkaliphilum TaxID=3039283 RepID=UPI002A51ECB1|nr:acyl-CoA dehydratase activase [Chitinispirillales bacterium ANBcel5]
MILKSLGICIGSASIKAAEITKNELGSKITKQVVQNHDNSPREAFDTLMKQFRTENYDFSMLTGRKFREMIDTPSITEPEAVEYSLRHMKENNLLSSNPGAVASLGAENFILYTLDQDHMISSVQTGNKCASGTGDFFFQQIRRMNVSVTEAVKLAAQSDEFPVSGRCSVFCKSDCTHALNKGIPVGRVSAGLCRMMAEKVLELLEKAPVKELIITGGISNNSVIISMLREKLNELYVPEFANVFEAVGAAHYALEQRANTLFRDHKQIKDCSNSFEPLPPIERGRELVQFKELTQSEAREGDELIIGLDVGSTTTKAVALRFKDSTVVGSVYLRTNGNPIEASRQCYVALLKQLKVPVKVIGLGTTGSGRQISGLHAQTSAVINEIIAHATAAAFFDKNVDTIFEIGGQDAKYTYLTNSVASDYAMNEACSAGTGSFLEESAGETLGINYKELEKIALNSKKPPNFNDQCAAFISSDIKTASHENISREDIVAGLVYSICMNYVNRVKGQRPSGKRIFMQGGVCYNKAVPLAMANLLGKPIIVPPEPGLMGAFGVAQEVKQRINDGQLDRSTYDLNTLAKRKIENGAKFTCTGGSEICDRSCEINTMIIEGKKYPFGGACNKYYNLIRKVSHQRKQYDLVSLRQETVYKATNVSSNIRMNKSIGLNRSFLTHMFYPLYHSFFSALGLDVILSNDISPEGMKRKRSSFCFPGEIAHGALFSLLKEKPDYLFLPKITELFVENASNRKKEHQCTCLLLQSEPYYLKSAFSDMLHSTQFISPVINFSKGYESQANVFGDIAQQVGGTFSQGIEAYHKAVEVFKENNLQIKELGLKALEELEKDPNKVAIVLFGRPYNAFTSEANMGIPGKFGSNGITIIPWDSLPFENLECPMDMNWAIGQNLIKAARFVKTHPQLFGTYITNFSCGPDSFLVGYFRNIMQSKPSLTLELDSHTADAGVNTRIDAFTDIIERYRSITHPRVVNPDFKPAHISFHNKTPFFVSSSGEKVELSDPRVHLLFPSMGELSSELIASTFSGAGIKASAISQYDAEVLKLGKGYSSCKECLPLILTTGGLLSYLSKRTCDEEFLVYFMPTSGGNCRLTQYNVYINSLIEKKRIPNVALLSLTNENGYAGLSILDALNVLKSIIISDCMEDIRNALLVLHENKDEAMEIFNKEWERIISHFRSGKKSGLYRLLSTVSKNLKTIKLKYPLKKAKMVSLLGEIFVRRDNFSCQNLIYRLSQRDIIVKRAPVFEWLEYCDYNVREGIFEADFTLKDKVEFKTRTLLQHHFERKIKSILSQSGLYQYEMTNIEEVIKYGENFFNKQLTGEPILVAGSYFKDILSTTLGSIQIGPFACMPTRVVEAVLSAEATVENKMRLDKKITGSGAIRSDIKTLPFLSIESDGNPFPQVLQSRIEAFCLQVERLHGKINQIRAT